MPHVPVQLERYGFKLWLDSNEIPNPDPGTIAVLRIMANDPTPPVDNSAWFVKVTEGDKVYLVLKVNMESTITEILKVRVK